MTDSQAKLILEAIRTEAETTKQTHGECTWEQDLDHEFFATSCGQFHCFIEGGPKENRHSFCPYCGGVLKPEPANY